MANKAKIFRELLKNNSYLIMPGAYDCLSAEIIESLGFDAIDITGLGIEAGRLGQPDLGLASMTEVVDQCSNIAESVSIPVIADADNGYGGIMNVARTARLLERGGVAGMHLEDQVIPKKCGNLPGKELIPLEDMVQKIKAAKDAVEDFVIIGRSDSRRFGLDEVKRRLHAYLDAGADLVMLGDDYPVEELNVIAREFFGVLYLVVAIYPGKEMCLPAAEYASMGVKCITYPTAALGAAAKAIYDLYTVLKEEEGLSEEVLSANFGLRDIEKFTHMARWQSLDQKFGSQ